MRQYQMPMWRRHRRHAIVAIPTSLHDVGLAEIAARTEGSRRPSRFPSRREEAGE